MNSTTFEALKKRIDTSTYEELEVIIKNITSKLEHTDDIDKFTIKNLNEMLKHAKETFEKVREEKAKELFNVTNMIDDIITTAKKQTEELKPYEELKKVFEENVFKIEAPAGYYINKYDRHTDLDSLSGLFNARYVEDLYRNLYYGEKELIKKTNTYEIKKTKFIKKWLDDETIKKYRTLVYKPKEKVEEDVFNIFSGFKAETMLRNGLTFEDLYKSRMFNHYKYIICNGDEKTFTYFMMYLSRLVKNPMKLTRVCIVLKGEQGSGKDFAWDYMGNNILGRRYYINTDKQEVMVGKFNGLISGKILAIFAESNNEINGNSNLVESIKNQLTNPVQVLEKKTKDPITFYNTCNIGATTNRDNSMNIDIGDRRFMIIDVNNKYSENSLLKKPCLRPDADLYFNELDKENKSGKYDRVFYDYLMSLDSDNFDFQNERIISKSYKDNLKLNLSIVNQFLINKLENNELLNKYQAKPLYELFKEWCNDNNINKIMTINKFGVELSNISGITKKKISNIFYEIDLNALKEHYKACNVYSEPDFIDV